MSELLKDFPHLHDQAKEIKPNLTRLIAMIDSGHCTWEELHEVAEQIFVLVEPVCDQFPNVLNEGDSFLISKEGFVFIPGPTGKDPPSN
jgi:hypothetical protein